MSSLPTSTVQLPAAPRDEVRETAGRRRSSLDASLKDFNDELKTVEAWQKKLIQKTNVVIMGAEGEGKITMVRKPILFRVANSLSGMLPINGKPIWLVGICIKWVPTCDLASSGTLILSIQNKGVHNPVLKDNTVVQMIQRVSTSFEIKYSSSSKQNSDGAGNPWAYSYEIKDMDDCPIRMELGNLIIMPIIKMDDKNTQSYSGVECEVYGGHFPLNIPAVSYCAPGPRFKTNLSEIKRNVEQMKRYLNVIGITDIDDEITYKVIQCCDTESAKILMKGLENRVWGPINDESLRVVKSLVYDCKSGRAISYLTLSFMEHLGSLGGTKTHHYT
nr:MAG: movement protein [Dichorhavirus sp. 'monocotyledonae']